MRFKKTVLVCILSLFVCLNLFSGTEEISFARSDDSKATAYISSPENCTTFPLIVYVDGSFMQSIKNNFNALSSLFNQKNIGVVAIEKRGIAKDSIDVEEFFSYDCFENRFYDHTQLIHLLPLQLPNWNGQLIFVGSSEGGKIAPKLSLFFSDQTMGTILIGSGGGLSFGEEIKYQIKQIAIENEREFNENELDRQIEEKFAEMLSRPKSLEKYYDKTYRWFTSYLKYHLLEDILKMHTPILMIHGALDTHIPIESADLINEAFSETQKVNLKYCRFEDLGHSISKRLDIFMLLLNFSTEHFHSEAAVGF